MQLVPVSAILSRIYDIALDIVASTPRYALGKHVLCHLKTLGFHCEFPDLLCAARAALYRTAVRSHVLSDLGNMFSEAKGFDEAYLIPRLSNWRASSVMAHLLLAKRALETIPGIP
eukprot:13236705-Heterocapsa_arctica.AAC.1